MPRDGEGAPQASQAPVMPALVLGSVEVGSDEPGESQVCGRPFPTLWDYFSPSPSSFGSSPELGV